MLKNVLVFVLLALPGYILVKKKFFDEKESNTFSKLLMSIGIPFLVLDSTLNINIFESYSQIGIISAFSVFFIFFSFIISFLIFFKDKDAKKKGMKIFCSIFPNNGFLGIPLAKAVFVNQPIIVTYVVVVNVITNIFIYTLGIYLISGDKKEMSFRKAFVNPVIISFLIGLVFAMLNVTNYVKEVKTYTSFLSGCVTPLAMFVIGMKLSCISFKRFFYSSKGLFFVSLLKLIIFPILIMAICLLLKRLLNITTEMVFGLFIAFSMPTAGLASTFADKLNGDIEGSVINILGTTIFSVLTIPCLFYLLNLFV